ncbi:major capsid protein [Flavobacterium chryseum]|uniref:major capsid protein n=1 Tax=Flavobacterium sp. P3160 TaxID=2512113 RepID=UPI001AAD4E7B|nr:major capsid protein [Flavobacterium sp. P3160]
MTYLYKEMLTEELSVDLQWKSLTVNSNIVAADIVALDSALPLKKRDSFGAASGDIPKSGMKLQLTEKQMTDIDVLKARNVETAVLVDKIFQDEVKCTMGIHEKMEFIFLQGLSTGVGLVEEENNVGTGVRVDYGYLAANKFGASVVWSDPNSKPIDDIKRIVKTAKAKGDAIKLLMMSDTTFDKFAENQQTRENYAFTQNFVGTAIPVPDLEQINSMMQRKFGLVIVVVDRTVTTERDGVRTVHTPWSVNNVIFLTSSKVGKLNYGILAEETRKSPKVMYEKSGSFILLKKWSTEEPFAEFTSSQAIAIPVINNVSSIYLLNVEEAVADAQTEGDANVNYKTVNYTKTSVIAAINLATGKTTAKSTNTDATLQKYINELSEEQVLVFEANIVAA